MSNSKEIKVKYHGNKDKKSKGRKKNPNVADISKQGYRDDSPYRSMSSIDIHTPSGIVDMSSTGIPLWANGQLLQPYSGQHFIGAEQVKEIPAKQTALAKKGTQVDSTIPVIDDAGSMVDGMVWVPDWKKMAEQAKKLGAKKVRTKSGAIINFDNNWEVVSVDDNPGYKKGGWLDQYQTTGEVSIYPNLYDTPNRITFPITGGWDFSTKGIDNRFALTGYEREGFGKRLAPFVDLGVGTASAPESYGYGTYDSQTNTSESVSPMGLGLFGKVGVKPSFAVGKSSVNPRTRKEKFNTSFFIEPSVYADVNAGKVSPSEQEAYLDALDRAKNPTTVMTDPNEKLLTQPWYASINPGARLDFSKTGRIGNIDTKGSLGVMYDQRGPGVVGSFMGESFAGSVPFTFSLEAGYQPGKEGRGFFGGPKVQIPIGEGWNKVKRKKQKASSPRHKQGGWLNQYAEGGPGMPTEETKKPEKTLGDKWITSELEERINDPAYGDRAKYYSDWYKNQTIDKLKQSGITKDVIKKSVKALKDKSLDDLSKAMGFDEQVTIALETGGLKHVYPDIYKDMENQGSLNKIKDTLNQVGVSNTWDLMDSIYPSVMDLRYNLGVNPSDVITEDTLDNFYKTKGKEKSSLDRLLKIYSKPKLVEMMNTVAENKQDGMQPPIAKKGRSLKKYQDGSDVDLEALKMYEEKLSQQLKKLGEILDGKASYPDDIYPEVQQLPTVDIRATMPEHIRDQQKAQFIQNLGNLDTGLGYELTVNDAFRQGLYNIGPYALETSNKAAEYNPPVLSENDALRLYLGLNQNYGSFMPSKYEKGAYDFAEGYQKLFPEKLPKDEKEIQKYLDNADDGKGLMDKSGKHRIANPFTPYGNFVMGRHQLRKGSDKKGDYIEYYDEWDLDTLGMAGTLADKTVGTPFKIRGRVYYDKKTGKRMDEYAPKYEPELKYKKSGGLIKAQDGKEMRKRVKKMTKDATYPVIPKSTLEVDDNLIFPTDESGVPIPLYPDYPPLNLDILENQHKFYNQDYQPDFTFMPELMMGKGGPLPKAQIGITNEFKDKMQDPDSGYAYQWLADWYNDPETQKRLNQSGLTSKEMDYAFEAMGNIPTYLSHKQIREHMKKRLDEYYKNPKKVNKELNQAMDEVSNLMLDTYGFYDSDNQFVYVEPTEVRRKTQTFPHELLHASDLDLNIADHLGLNKALIGKKLKEFYPDLYSQAKKNKDQAAIDIMHQAVGSEGDETTLFKEIYPYIMGLRYELGVKPGETITEEMLDKYKKSIEEKVKQFPNQYAPDNSNLHRLLKMYSQPKLIQFMNTVAENRQPEMDMPMAKRGGLPKHQVAPGEKKDINYYLNQARNQGTAARDNTKVIVAKTSKKNLPSDGKRMYTTIVPDNRSFSNAYRYATNTPRTEYMDDASEEAFRIYTGQQKEQPKHFPLNPDGKSRQFNVPGFKEALYQHMYYQSLSSEKDDQGRVYKDAVYTTKGIPVSEFDLESFDKSNATEAVKNALKMYDSKKYPIAASLGNFYAGIDTTTNPGQRNLWIRDEWDLDSDDDYIHLNIDQYNNPFSIRDTFPYTYKQAPLGLGNLISEGPQWVNKKKPTYKEVNLLDKLKKTGGSKLPPHLPEAYKTGGWLDRYQVPPGEKKDFNYYLDQARNQGTAVRDNTNAPNVPQRVKMQESIDQIDRDLNNMSDDQFRNKYGLNKHGWQYKNRPAYKAKVDADIVAKRKQGIPEIKKEVKVNPNMMFMAPNATSAEQAQNVIDYNLGVIGAALPIPGLQSIKMSAPIAGTSRELPSILSMASKPERLIRNLPIGKRNQLAMLDHLLGLKKGMYDIKKGRPFFETFPITKAQKKRIMKLQDEARDDAEKFVFDYIYGPESSLASRDVVRNVHSDIYNKMSAFEPGYTFRMPQRDFALPSPNQLDDLNFSSSNIMIGHLGENRPRLVSPRRSAMMREVSQDPALSKHADYFKSHLDNDRSTSLGWNTTNDYGPNVTLRGNGFYYRTPRDIAETVVHETGHTFQKMGRYGHPLWGGKNSIGAMIAIDDQNITPYRFANTNTPIGSRIELAMVEPKKWEDDLVKIEKKYFPNDDYDLKWQEAYVNQSLSPNDLKQFQDKESLMNIEKDKFKALNSDEYYTWEASPLELHSELMTARYKAFKQLKKQFNITDEEALDIIRSGSLDDLAGREFMTDGKIKTFTPTPNYLEKYLIQGQGLNRFFKKATPEQERYDLIRILPAAGGLGLAGSLYESPYEKEGLQRQKTGGPLPKAQTGIPTPPASYYKRLYGSGKDLSTRSWGTKDILTPDGTQVMHKGYRDPSTGYIYFSDEGNLDRSTGQYIKSNQQKEVPESKWNTSRFLFDPFIRGAYQGQHDQILYDTEYGPVAAPEPVTDVFPEVGSGTPVMTPGSSIDDRFMAAKQDITNYYKYDVGLNEKETKKKVKDKMKDLRQMYDAYKSMKGLQPYKFEDSAKHGVFNLAVDPDKQYYWDHETKDINITPREAKKAYVKFQKAWRDTPGREARKNARQELKNARERFKEQDENWDVEIYGPKPLPRGRVYGPPPNTAYPPVGPQIPEAYKTGGPLPMAQKGKNVKPFVTSDLNEYNRRKDRNKSRRFSFKNRRES